MSDLLGLITSRTFVVTLAVVGAIVATVGNRMMREGSSVPPSRARTVVWTGYALTGASIFCFIVAGFLAGT